MAMSIGDLRKDYYDKAAKTTTPQMSIGDLQKSYYDQVNAKENSKTC